jgi:hypothetical protein
MRRAEYRSYKESIVRWLTIFLALCAAAGAAVSGTADAHGRVGIFIGGPIYPFYYPPPPYYYPYPQPVIVEPARPVVYVEQGQGAPDAEQQRSQGTWYYCEASRTYYPYVKQCAGGWREVPATPPAPGR